MDQYRQSSSSQELEQMRSAYTKLVEEQKTKTKEVEKALEKEREMRMKETVQVEIILAQKLLQQETKVRAKYDEMVLLLQQRESEARRREAELTELTENMGKRREAIEAEMQQRFVNLAAEHAKKVQDEQHSWAAKQRDMVEKEHIMELQATRHAEELEREVSERFKKLQEEALAREKERETERMVYRREIEDKYENAKIALDEDLSRAEAKLEKDLNAKYQQLSEKLQEKDREREAEKQNFKREHERKYETQVSAIRGELEAEFSSRSHKLERELANKASELENEKEQYKIMLDRRFDERVEQDKEGTRKAMAGLARYEGQLRGQYAQARAQDNDDLWALRHALKEEERILHDSFRLKLEELKNKETEMEMEKSRYEQKVKDTFQKSFDDETAKLKEQRKQLELTEMEFMDTKEKLEIDYERRRAATEREMQAEFDAKLSSIKSNLEQQDATRRAELENQYSNLRLESEKEFSIRKEELERDFTTRVRRLASEAEARDRERDAAKIAYKKFVDEEREKDRARVDAELAIRKEGYDKEFAAILMKTQDDAAKKEQERQKEMESFKKNFYLQIEKMRVDLEEESLQKRDRIENELKSQHQKIRDELLQRDRDRDDEKTEYKLELDRNFEKHLLELREYESKLDREKAQFEAETHAEYEIEKRTLAERAQADAAQVQAERKEVIANFHKMVEEHRVLMDQELKENADKAQKELEARVKSELQRQGEFIQAQQEAVNASNAILNDLSSALAVEREKVSALQKQVTLHQTEALEAATAAVKREEDMKVRWAHDVSQLKNNMNTELVSKEKTILDLSEKLAAHERETTIWKEKVARETEVEMKAKYEAMRQEFEKAFLDELNESRAVREEFYKKKEQLIYEQRQQMLDEVRTFRATMAAELNELRENNEKSLFENHQKIVESDSRALEEGRDLLETRKREFQLEYQRLMNEYHQKTNMEAKRRQELHEKELDDRRQHESLMAKLRDDLEKEFLDKRQKLNEEFLVREKHREDEVTNFKESLEDSAEQRQRTHEIDMARARQELETITFNRNALLKETLLEKDRMREEECATLKLELESKYDARVVLLESQERQLADEKMFYDSKLRDQYMLERENDIKAISEARKELETHHKSLYSKTLDVLQKFKQDLDDDMASRYEKGERELLDMADDELIARAKFAKQQAEFQQVADNNLGKVKNELLTMEQQHKALRSELQSIRADKSVAEAEHMRNIDEIKVHQDKIVSDIKNQSNRDLMIKETLLIELREQLQAHNRENEIWRERIKREVEGELNLRYAEKKKEFELRMEEDTKIILQKQDELLEERRVSIAKEEQEQLARIQQIRQSHEITHLKKLESIEKTLLQRSQQLEDEYIGRIAEVEQEKSEFKRDMELRTTDLQREREKELQRRKDDIAREFERRQKSMAEELDERFKSRLAEVEVQRGDLQQKFDDMVVRQSKELALQREGIENEVLTKIQSLREQLLVKDNQRDKEKLQFKMDLDAQFEAKLLSFRNEQAALDTAKATFENELRLKYEKMKDKYEAELLTHKKTIEEYEKELYANFQKMVDQHQEQLDLESRERAKRARADLEARKDMELDYTRNKEEFEKRLVAKYEELQDEVLARDRTREQDMSQLKLEVQKDYDERLRKTREHEAGLTREKAMYESALREKYRKSAEQEAELLLEQKRKLDQYSQELHASFRTMVSEYQAQLDQEAERHAADARDFLQNLAATEITRRQELVASIAENEVTMKTTLQNMTSQLNKLEFEHKALSLEAETLRAVIAESKSETLIVREELIGEHAKELSALRIKTSADIADRDRKLIELTEKISSHERELAIEKERIQGEIETRILLKYENAQREFEQKLLHEVNNSKSMHGDVLKKREDHVQKLELEISEKIHKLRLQQELEFSQKQMTMTKELTEKYQNLQREIMEKDRTREIEAERSKMELAQQTQDVKRELEIEHLKAKQHLEAELNNRYRSFENELHERDKQREEATSNLRDRLTQEHEQRLSSLRADQSELASMRANLEHEMSKKYQLQQESDAQELAEARKQLEDREMQMLERVQSAIALYQEQLDAEAKDRQKRVIIELEERKRLEFELSQKRDEFEREFLQRQHQVQEELMQRERERELEKSKFRSEVNAKYEQKMETLREFQSSLQHQFADYELVLRDRYEKAVSHNSTALQQQKESVHVYEAQLREQFDRLVREHQARADSALAAIATKTTKHAEEMVNYELERQAVILQKLVTAESQMDEAMERVKTELAVMEGHRAESVATISNLRVQLTEQEVVYSRNEAELRQESDTALSNFKNELNTELADRHHKIIELTQTLAAKERETQVWKEKTRTELETDIHKANAAQQSEFEQKVLEAMQESLHLQQKAIKERENHIMALEKEMFERVARAREQLEAEIVQGAARLESDIMDRHQKSIEDMHKREREREESKIKYKREIDEYLEKAERALHTQEVTLEKERIAYEQKTREKFENIHDQVRAAIAEERNQLQLEEDQRALKYQAMVTELEQQLIEDTKMRTELQHQLAEYGTLSTELERKKEELDATFSLRVVKLQEDTALRERERMRAQETYRKEIDKKLEDGLQSLRTQEEKMNIDMLAFEKDVLDKADRTANLDRDMLKRHQNRLSEYEKHLVAKCNLMLEEYRTRVGTDVEFHFSKRRQAIDTAVDDELENMDRIQKENSKFDSYIQDALDRVRGEITHMETNNETLQTQMADLRMESARQEAEWMRRIEAETLQAEQTLSEARVIANTQLTERQLQINALRDQLASHEREATVWRDKTRRELESELKLTYEEVHKEFEKRFVDESNSTRRRQQEKDLIERMEFEADVRTYYEKTLIDTENSMREKFNSLLAESESNARKHRFEQEQKHKEDVASLTTTRIELEESFTTNRKEFEKEIKEKYENVMLEYRKQLEGLLKEREEGALDMWKSNEKELAGRARYEEDVRAKYSTLMERQKDEFEAARQELLTSYTSEMERRDKLLAEQSASNKMARKAYEEEVRTKYLGMLEQHSAILQQEQRQSLEKEMQELEKRATDELQRVQRLEAAEKRFQEEARLKYESLISQLENSWKLEISNRERQLDERYKEHYESLLTAKDEQLSLAVDINHAVDQAERDRWAHALETLQNKHNAIFYELEEKMKVKYDGMLQEYEKLYQKQFEQYEAHHVQQYLSLEHNRRVQQKKIARFKIAMAKWKFDYQAQMHEKYEHVLSDLQSRYLAEVEERMRDQTSKQEHMAKINLQLKERNFTPPIQTELYKKSLLDLKPGISIAVGSDVKPTTYHSASLPRSSVGDKEHQLSSMKASIQKLWENLETDSSEITAFLKVVHTAAPDTEALMKLYTREGARLNTRLMLMQKITRREFLRHRLAALDSNKGREIKDDEELIRLRSDLKSISEVLRREVPEYELEYKEKFMYRGTQYAETLALDL